MPWPEKQRKAIFMDVKRRKGEAAAKAVMHEAGYGGQSSSTHGKLRRKRGSTR